MRYFYLVMLCINLPYIFFLQACNETGQNNLIYFYKAQQNLSPLFESTNGQLKSGISLASIKDNIFVIDGQDRDNIVTKATLPASPKNLIIDGKYAIKFDSQYEIGTLNIAHAFVEINEQVRIGKLKIGTGTINSVINSGRVTGGIFSPASLIFTGKHPIIAGKISLIDSFLTVRSPFLITPHWKTSLGVSAGLVIDNAGLFISSSTLTSPPITIKEGSSVKLFLARIQTPKLILERQASVLIGKKSQIIGDLYAQKGSVLFFKEELNFSDFPLVPSITVSKEAFIDGNISIRSISAYPNEFHLARYRQHIAQYDRFVLVEAQQLKGRASLMSEQEADRLINTPNTQQISDFEKLTDNSGKKLALQHDYIQGKLFLVIIDKATPLDSQNCLPDIGFGN